MDLEPTEDQAALRGAVAEWLDHNCSMDVVRGVAEGTTDHDVLWPAMVELGWPALTVPEPDGGLGFGIVEMTLVAEELGRHVAPGPLLATAIAVPFLVGAASEGAVALRAAIAGGASATVGVAERADGWAPEALTAGASHKRWVLDAHAATHALAIVASGDGFDLVDVTAAEASPIVGLDPTRRLAELSLGGGTDPLHHFAADEVRFAIAHGTVLVAAETVGCCQAAFDLTVDYAKVREQFDRPIGAFQAVKHQLADAYVQVEKARALAHLAAVTIAEDDERRATTVAMAKAAAGDCQAIVAEKVIQVHGGIGYTWEHDAHLYVKRMKANDLLFGTARHHRRHIAEATLAA
ncbi:MAG TPA: acyl-CoA dehydrogenase family protein [Nitriliruptorales bacterium]